MTRKNWSIVYTHNRDSGLLDQSNAEVIARALTHFTTGDNADVVFESHAHWAVGHVDGFSIRVYRDGEITDAFRTYHALSRATRRLLRFSTSATTPNENMRRLSTTSSTPAGG